jgi:cellulose synthase/poly-beta-1,6-N-acetylglucosamine synthase-like glycosyltransferase
LVLLTAVASSIALAVYTFAVYPLILRIVAIFRPGRRDPRPPEVWPKISITLAAYNEESRIRATCENLLQLDYPADRRQILIVSDASTDATDDIISSFAEREVELVRLDRRKGKTAAENVASRYLTGDIVVNTDASVRIEQSAIKALVVEFEDPAVGVASGRDVSVDPSGGNSNVGESGYVGYEMWLRSLETRVASIVQASGCLYAARRELHSQAVPEMLTRDLATPSLARERGYRSVSVDSAICFVPRLRSLRREYRRKVRTMTRGLGTLNHKRKLLNPVRYGAYAWMLFSHKLCRWLVPVAITVGLAAAAFLAPSDLWARLVTVAAALGIGLATMGWLLWPEDREMPKVVEIAAYSLIANVAALTAWLNLFSGKTNPSWSPSRRQAVKEH